MRQAKGIISTVQLAFEGKEDYKGVASTLDVAWDLLEEIWKKIDLAMEMVAGRYPDKKAVTTD